jgi:outer membrane protein assembly factor BamB
MKLNISTAVYIILFCLAACSKSKNEHDDQGPENSVNLTPFSVKVLERTPLNAILQWDSCINKLNSEPVKYRVILENKIVKDSLTRLTDTLLNLEKNRTYTGKVVAYISTGDTTFSDFNLSTYDGQLFAYTNDGFSTSRFGCFNLYPIPRIQTQPSIWRYATGSVRTPTLSNDTMFLVVDNKLQAVNANTGVNIWQGPATISFITTATYSAGKLYACANTGELVCLNSSNGQVLWTYRSPLSYLNFNSVPVVDNNIVIVGIVNFSHGEMHAVDALTGQKIWLYAMNTSICQRPLAVNGVVVISSGIAGRIFALSASTGKLIWEKANLSSVGRDSFEPVYIDGKVLAHTYGPLYALDLKTGTTIWEYNSNGRSLSNCVTGNGMVYFCKDSIGPIYSGYSDRTLLKCISAKDGHEIWSQGGTMESEYYSHPVFAKDKVYCIYKNGFSARLMAYNATTGARDIPISNSSPVPAILYEELYNFCIKRDGINYYPSSHGNYQ